MTCHDILRDARRRSFPLINPGSKPLYITSRWSYCKFTGILRKLLRTADGRYWGQLTDVIEDSWRMLLRTADGRYWGQLTDVIEDSWRTLIDRIRDFIFYLSRILFVHVKDINYTCHGCIWKTSTLLGHLTDEHVTDVILTSVRCHPKNIREGSICSEVFEKFIGKNRSLTCPNKILDM